MDKIDVIIVGGGPAGSTCAWHLHKNNFKCLILDKQSFPRNKLCAGLITPKVIKNLEIDLDQYPHKITTYSGLSVVISGIKIKIPTKQFAIRRVEFDHWLLKRSGVQVIKHNVNTINQKNGGYIIDDKFYCKYLICAGGTNCPVYKSLFKNITPRSDDALIVTLEEEFVYDHTDDKCQLWFLENGLPGYAWYVPKQNGYVNIGLGARQKILVQKKDHIKDHWNRFINKLETLSLIKNHNYKPKGCSYYIRSEINQVQLGNAFISGDAAGLATIDMGEGIGPAIKSGFLAAESIISGKSYNIESIKKYSFIHPSLSKVMDYIFNKRNNSNIG